ncbi:MATE family efflux transporter [Psychrosphaera saromensis]|jgi:putative MATE family efflux protein|uniref:MATE family efflux transporter n=2 Tax=Psychrosphaera saromensis TaxID=716813 RepID=A0A2S7UUR8_9GAMM|nr:MATE family efflux transporter [Psychrosphaera saromensis]PQJ53734.1 MATE family efflux transporter [Psychrosphaera saromensis]
MSSSENLLTAPIGPVLKKMTKQVLFGMMMLMSFNLVDTYFIGLLGTDSLAAISFTFPVTFTIISLSIGLGIGTSAVIAKARGANLLEQAKDDGLGALILSFVLVAALAFCMYSFTDEIFTLLGAKADLLPLIHEYMDIWYIGAVFLMSPMVGNSILRASGDAKTPSIIMAVSGLINAILDPLLIFGLGPFPELGMQGAAISSVIAWGVGFFVVIYVLAVKRKLIWIRWIPFTQFVAVSRRILKIGLPAAGANMLTPIAMAVLTAMIAVHGNAAVAGFGVGTRLESIASMVVLALSMTLPPFISQNFGAGQWDRVEQAYKSVIKFVLLWQLAVYLLLAAVAGYIAMAFGKNDPEVMNVIKLFIWTLPLSYGFQGIIILSNSSLNALHKPMKALLLSVIRLFVFYVPFAYLGSVYFGLIGLFIGALIGNVFTALIAYRWFLKALPQSVVVEAKV